MAGNSDLMSIIKALETIAYKGKIEITLHLGDPTEIVAALRADLMSALKAVGTSPPKKVTETSPPENTEQVAWRPKQWAEAVGLSHRTIWNIIAAHEVETMRYGNMVLITTPPA